MLAQDYSFGQSYVTDATSAFANLGDTVTPDLVLVEQRSAYASQSCSLRVQIADLSGGNGRVHDVQKLAETVFAQVR